MAYLFFYSSIIILVPLFATICVFRRPGLPNIIIGLTTVGYSLVSDILFGDQMKFFYYINPQISTLYMVLSSIMIYSVLNMAYTMFLPDKFRDVFLYTLCWIAAMLLFEFASLLAKTIVFTGWRMLPWSVVIYLVTYLWICTFYRFLTGRIPKKA